MKRNFYFLSYISIILAIIIFSVIYYCNKNKNISELVKIINVGVQDNTIVALIWIAQGKGYFKDQGLQVNIIRYPSGKLALNGMLNDEVDISTSADVPIMKNSFIRNDFFIFASIANTDKGAWIIARKDHGINTEYDLIGKKIGTQKFSAVHFFLSMFLLNNKIPESRTNIIFEDALNLPDMLINGNIDAFSMRDPFINTARNVLKDKAIEFFAPGIYEQKFILAAKKKIILEKKALIKKFLKALLNAQKFLESNKENAIDVTIKEMGIERKKEIICDWEKINFKLSLNQSLMITLEDQARWAIENKFTNKKVIPNYLNYFHFNSLKSIKPEAVSVIYE